MSKSYDSLFGGMGSDPFGDLGASPDGLGGSPDGLGDVDENSTPEDMSDPDDGPQHDFNIPRGGNAYEPGGSPQYPYGAMAGPVDFIEPDDTSSAAATRSAGLTVLFVAAAAGIGYAMRGGLGATSGLLLAGSAANVYRAQKWWKSSDPSEKHEAVVSAVFAAGGILAGGYVGYKAMERGR